MDSLGNLIFYLTMITALGCGLIAGAFFAFSTFVMRALSRISPAEGIAAMQSINISVINPIFLGVFLGTAAASFVLAILALLRWQTSGAAFLLCGCILYLSGTFLVTVIFNVPLNDALAAVEPSAPDSVTVWNRYVTVWTFWNHIRTIAGLAATASLIFALVRRAGQV